VLHRVTIRLALFAAGLGTGAHAYAMERVTLNTGFSYDCTRHEPAEGDRVRLYLLPSDGQASENFIEIEHSSRIVSIELLPDPPKPQPSVPPPATAIAQTAPPASTDVHELLAQAGAQHNIDVDLLASIVHAESGGNARAISRAGARGLMQLMPATARDLGVNDAFKPDQNIKGGTAYLDMLLIRYDDPRDPKHGLDLALAAYNAGPAAVDRYHGIPPYAETRAYVARVEREFIRRKAASQPAVATTSH